MKPVKHEGIVTLSDYEVANMAMPLDQFVLSRIKGEGGPIEGLVNLKMSTGYELSADIDYASAQTSYKWRPIRGHLTREECQDIRGYTNN